MLDFSVAARQVRVKFVVTDVMYPVQSVAKLTEQEFKVEFGQQARLVGLNRRDAVSVELRRRSGPTGYKRSGAPRSRQP